MKYRGLGSISVNADVDIDDILDSLTNSEKRQLFDELKEDLGYDEPEDRFNGTTTEVEMFKLCEKIYENRNFLTNEDVNLLVKLSKKGLYDKV